MKYDENELHTSFARFAPHAAFAPAARRMAQGGYAADGRECVPYRYNAAYAVIIPGPDYPSVRGIVTFAGIPGGGVAVCADITGLPPYRPASGGRQPIGPFGFHIHEKGVCEPGDAGNPFQSSGGHWNPADQPHGNHAGDFPVLVADGGRARMCFIISRFTVDDIIGRSVIIHESPDDYRTQPAGNSGKRIACGVIRPWKTYDP